VPELVGLQLLLAVQSSGSLTAAAAAAGVSQQAVSGRVRAMEAQIGVPLLTRSPQGSRLTPAGELVAQWAGGVVDAARVLEAGIASLRASRDTELRLFASLTIAEHLVPRWLVTMQEGLPAEQPVTAVHLVATNSDAVITAVRDGAAALGFVEGPAAPRGVRHRTVGRDRLVILVAPGHPWARRRSPLTATELAETPLVSRESGSGTRAALTHALTPHLRPGTELAAPVLQLSSSAAVRASIAAGVGPGALSGLAVADDLALHRLVALALPGVDLRRRLRAVWASGREPPAGPARTLLAIAARSSPELGEASGPAG